MLMEMEMLQGKPPGHLQAEAFLTTFFFYYLGFTARQDYSTHFEPPQTNSGEMTNDAEH